ncbi:MAG: flagellar hook-basal body complex protein FliE [Pseudomonadota bacterium]
MTVETSLATTLYAAARREGITPSADTGGSDGFADALAEAARALEQSLRQGESVAGSAVRGSGDMQGLVEALSSAEMAIETAVVMRDRVVEAYQEILRMPV